MKKIRIATRKSKLAMWQANHVKHLLKLVYPKIQVELVGIITQGDRVQNKSLADIGGKGLFIKTLEQALLSHSVDIAVHSMKDVPPLISDEFCIAAILKRDDPRDAFISTQYESFSKLPTGAVIGTCSVRRQAQLLHHRPDLCIKPLRGNVDTRLEKLDAGDFDAIILAAAGLKRLGYEERVREYFSVDFMLPSVAQGAIGIECCSDNKTIIDLIKPLQDDETSICVEAERDLIRALNGDCYSPIGSYAQLIKNELLLRGLVASADGKHCLSMRQSAPFDECHSIGKSLAFKLSEKGAGKYL